MSIVISEKVWERAIESVPKLILLKCANHANDEGKRIFPGNESVRAAAGLADVSTVKRRLKQFRRLGILVPEEKPVMFGQSYRKSWKIDLDALARHFPLVSEVQKPPRLSDLVNALSDLEADLEKGGSEPSRKGGAQSTGAGAGEPPTQGPGSPPNRKATVKEPSRARGDDPEGSPRGCEEDSALMPQNAHWLACDAAIKRRFGERAFSNWLASLKVAKDDVAAKRMVLLVSRRIDRDRIEKDFKDGLEKVLDRQIEVVFMPPGKRNRALLQLEEKYDDKSRIEGPHGGVKS